MLPKGRRHDRRTWLVGALALAGWLTASLTGFASPALARTCGSITIAGGTVSPGTGTPTTTFTFAVTVSDTHRHGTGLGPSQRPRHLVRPRSDGLGLDRRRALHGDARAPGRIVGLRLPREDRRRDQLRPHPGQPVAGRRHGAAPAATTDADARPRRRPPRRSRRPRPRRSRPPTAIRGRRRKPTPQADREGRGKADPQADPQAERRRHEGTDESADEGPDQGRDAAPDRGRRRSPSESPAIECDTPSRGSSGRPAAGRSGGPGPGDEGSSVVGPMFGLLALTGRDVRHLPAGGPPPAPAGRRHGRSPPASIRRPRPPLSASNR